MNKNLTSTAWRRHSLLFRNPALNQEQFSRHYETHHGPLAASLEGFRKYCWRYVQNHVESLPDGREPRFHGITMTSQVPRVDYRKGFFNEPDYEKVKPDELYLFDVSRTVSVLGCEEPAEGGLPTPWKALLLAQPDFLDSWQPVGLTRKVLNSLDTSSASALGFNSSQFSYGLLVELWFTSEAARDEAYAQVAAQDFNSSAPFFLPVREVLIYGPEKPWTPSFTSVA
ncbi:MAG: EthD domain-containing protein [Rhodoferax sp.]